MFGLTEEFTMASGLITRWRVKEHLLGVMVGDMLVSIKMIKNTVREHLNGQMEESISENGVKENNTEKEPT